eukprot:370863-Ditylum_brightwellii.AAC.1
MSVPASPLPSVSDGLMHFPDCTLLQADPRYTHRTLAKKADRHSKHHWTQDQKTNATPCRRTYTPLPKTNGQAPLDAHPSLKSCCFGGHVAPSTGTQCNNPEPSGTTSAHPEAHPEWTSEPAQNDGTTTSTKKRSKRKWTRDQKAKIIKCYYIALDQCQPIVKGTYMTWRKSVDQTEFESVTAVTLNGVCTNAMKKAFRPDEL